MGFFRVKERLKILSAALGIELEIPSRDDILAFSRGTIYFKDIAEVIRFIDNVGSGYLSGYNPDDDLLMIKSIAVLAWNQFPVKKMLAIKRADIISGEGFDFKSLSGQEYAVLKNFALSDGYRAIPNNKPTTFKGDDTLLFRVTRYGVKDMDHNDIAGFVKRFRRRYGSASKI